MMTSYDNWKLSSPNCDLEERAADQVADMTLDEVITNLIDRIPYVEDELRERLTEALIDEYMNN